MDALWGELSKGGTPLMELGKYPFSERYGWLQDRYGLSWQVLPAGVNELRIEEAGGAILLGEGLLGAEVPSLVVHDERLSQPTPAGPRVSPVVPVPPDPRPGHVDASTEQAETPAVQAGRIHLQARQIA